MQGPNARGGLVKTTPRICNRKKRFVSRERAEEVVQVAAARGEPKLRAYKCELCHQYHLTSRTKGMKLPAYEVVKRREARLATTPD